MRRRGSGFCPASTAIASALAVALAVVPAPVAASANTAAPDADAPQATTEVSDPAGDGASVPDEVDPQDQGALWRDAMAKLGTADYPAAIDRLTQLFELVVNDPEASALRDRVRMALYDAHVGAYDLDKDAGHLEIALDLLDKLEAVSPEDADAQADITAKREQAQALLDAHVEPAPIPPPTPDPEPEPEVQPQPEPEPEPEPIVEPPDPHAGRPLIISGAVMVSLGAVGAGLLIGGLASANNAIKVFETRPRERQMARDDIKRGNALGIAGGVVGGVFTVAGAVLIGLGMRQRDMAIGPTADANMKGITWVGRF